MLIQQNQRQTLRTGTFAVTKGLDPQRTNPFNKDLYEDLKGNSTHFTHKRDSWGLLMWGCMRYLTRVSVCVEGKQRIALLLKEPTARRI